MSNQNCFYGTILNDMYALSALSAAESLPVFGPWPKMHVWKKYQTDLHWSWYLQSKMKWHL